MTLDDEQRVIDQMMRHLQHTSIAADVAQSAWQEAHTVRIVREEPVWSERGKFAIVRDFVGHVPVRTLPFTGREV